MIKRSPLSDPWIYVVVFCGGFVGTGLRYVLGLWLNPMPQFMGIHWGTLTANLIACFVYACITVLISVYLHGSYKGDLLSRGLGMGMCGGLSTMSTLAFEIASSHLGWVYAIISIALGIGAAFLGARCGAALAKGKA